MPLVAFASSKQDRVQERSICLEFRSSFDLERTVKPVAYNGGSVAAGASSHAHHTLDAARRLTRVLSRSNIVGNQLCGSLGQLGTPVGNVGQNNPNATRLVPNPGNLPACSGKR